MAGDRDRASVHELSAVTITIECAPSPPTTTRIGSPEKQPPQPATLLLGLEEPLGTTSSQKSAYSAQVPQLTTRAARFLTYDPAKDIHFAADSATTIPGPSTSTVYRHKSKTYKPGAGSPVVATKWRKRHSATNSLELGRSTSLNKTSRTFTIGNMFGMGRLSIAEGLAIPMTLLHPHALLSPKPRIITHMDCTTKGTSKDST